jgi:hypothetical protein
MMKQMILSSSLLLAGLALAQETTLPYLNLGDAKGIMVSPNETAVKYLSRVATCPDGARFYLGHTYNAPAAKGSGQADGFIQRQIKDGGLQLYAMLYDGVPAAITCHAGMGGENQLFVLSTTGNRDGVLLERIDLKARKVNQVWPAVVPPAIKPPKTDAPAATPATTPAVEPPKTDAPATTPATTPAVEPPKTDAPATTPTTTPAVEPPKTDAPATTPTTTPVVEPPKTDTPATPVAITPITPAVEPPKTDAPVTIPAKEAEKGVFVSDNSKYLLQNIEAKDMAVDAAGNAYVLATSTSTTTQEDILVAKFGADHKLAWVRLIDGSGQEVGNRIAVVGDKVWLVGESTSDFPDRNLKHSGRGDILIAQLDAKKGDLLGLSLVGTPERDAATALAITGQRVFVAGLTQGRLRLGNTRVGSDPDAVLLAINTNINFANTAITRANVIAQFGTTSADQPNDLAALPNGDVLLVGSTDGVFVGQIGKGVKDIFAASYSPSGKQQSLKQFGSGEADDVLSVAVNKDGSMVLAGLRFAGGFAGHVSYWEKDFVAMGWEQVFNKLKPELLPIGK